MCQEVEISKVRDIKHHKDIVPKQYIPSSMGNEPKFKVSVMNLLLNFSSGRKEVLFKRISKTNANSNKKFTYINCQREFITGKIKIVLSLRKFLGVSNVYTSTRKNRVSKFINR